MVLEHAHTERVPHIYTGVNRKSSVNRIPHGKRSYVTISRLTVLISSQASLTSFLTLTYVNRRSTFLSRRQDRLDAALLGVGPVDSVAVREVDWQAGGPTQAVRHEDLPLLTVQPGTLNLGCFPAVGPVQHPAETQQRLQSAMSAAKSTNISRDFQEIKPDMCCTICETVP